MVKVQWLFAKTNLKVPVCRTYRTTALESLQQGLPAEQSTCKQGSRSPAGPRRLGTATRISASLSRRLSAFFGSTHDQAPKAVKHAVLVPGPGMFVNVQYVSRVMIAPHPKCPLFRRVSRCVRSFEQSRVCTHFRPRKQTWAVCARS